MRLIDADALLNEFLRRYTERERNRNLVFAACEIKQDFADMISDFPTVDAASGAAERRMTMAEQRLIDANNLIEEIREERCYNCRNFKDMKCDYCGTADYIYMIEDMPTVEAKPVVHAHWEPKKIMVKTPFARNYYCSNCKDEPFECKHICGNCGAQMDEKEDR